MTTESRPAKEGNMVRTQDQIVARLRTENARDYFGWASGDLLEWLDFERAKEFLKEGVTEEQWNESRKDQKPVRQQAIDYMPFAWEKANDERGLSAGRSMNHYCNWLWLMGEDELAQSMLTYQYYGKENLIRVCEFLGLDHKQWDDGERSNG
jgi:hypothetical protein